MLKKLILLGIVLSFCSGILIAQGNFWEEITLPATVNPFPTSFVSSSNGDIYTGTNNYGIFKSTDNGSSWTQVFSTQWNIESLAVNSIDNIFAGTSAGVYRSTNSGGSWAAMGLTYNPTYTIGVNPSDDIFAGTANGIYKSIDNGNIWNITSLDTPYFHDICIKPSGDIYVATGSYSEVVYLSRDAGDTWTVINTGLHPYYSIIGVLSIDYVNDTIYCGMGSGQGVYKSNNNGSNWVQSGLNTSTVTC